MLSPQRSRQEFCFSFAVSRMISISVIFLCRINTCSNYSFYCLVLLIAMSSKGKFTFT